MLITASILVFAFIAIQELTGGGIKSKGISALLASRERTAPPIPEPALSYLLSQAEGGAGRAVAVVLLGRRWGGSGSSGAERWLRPLHAAARRPLLLWWNSLRRPSLPPPPWLEKQRGYMLLAHSLKQLTKFLTEECEGVLDIPGEIHAFLKINRQNLQLSSTAPTLMIVEENNKKFLRTSQWRSETWKVLASIAVHHQSYRSLLIQEEFHENWTAVFLTVRSDGSGLLLEGDPESCALEAARLLTKLDKCLTGHIIEFHMSFKDVFFIINPKSPGRGDVIYPASFHFMTALQEHFNFTSEMNHLYYENPEHEVDEADTMIHDMVNSSLAVSVTHFSLFTESTQFSLLPASAQWTRVLVLVPQPARLPAWSLPLRVFGPAVWAALAGACVSYALGWRVVAREPVGACVAAALRVFSSYGGPPQERVVSTPQRVQLAGALLASAVVVVAAYQGRLYTLQVNPERYSGYSNLKELLIDSVPLSLNHESDIQVLKTYVQNKLELELLPNEYWRYEDLETIQARDKAGEMFGWVVHNEEWATLQSLYHLSSRWKVLENSEIIVDVYMHARRNFPWTDLFNYKLLQLIDGGIWYLWRNEKLWQAHLYVRSRLEYFVLKIEREDAPVSGPFNFGMEDIVSHFFILAIGLLLSGTTFLIELYIHV